MHFDPNIPFPLQTAAEYSYSAAKEHSVAVDRWLGFEIDKIEMSLVHDIAHENGRWHGLPAQSLLTPYVEVRWMLSLCNPQAGQTVIDLGCAYGRMAHVIHRHFSNVSFIGYEIETARVREAKRILAGIDNSNLQIIEQDLTANDFHLPDADFYFLYDYGTQENIAKTLNDLKAIACRRRIQVIARGRGTRFQIHRNHPWLAEVHAPIHTTNFSIYRS